MFVNQTVKRLHLHMYTYAIVRSTKQNSNKKKILLFNGSIHRLRTFGIPVFAIVSYSMYKARENLLHANANETTS